MDKRVMKLRGDAAMLAVAGLALAGVSYPREAHAQAPMTIHFQEHATNSSYIAIGSLFGNKSAAGAQGDYLVWDDPLFDPNTNGQIGQSMGQCTLVNARNQIFECFDTIYLTGRGTLSFQGGFGPKGTLGPSAVTGGTGQFLGAVGTGTIEILNNGAIDDWTVRLVRFN